MRKDKVTARDVAKAAGVSPATVSLVFRDKPGVGNETREHVLSVAHKLGFEYAGDIPHRKTSTILLVIYKRHGQVVGETQFFETLTKGISDATYRYGYHRLSISYFYAQEHPSEQLKALASIKCAGIILLATEMHSKDITQFTRLGVPIVLLDSWFPTKDLDAIVIDNMCGAWEAVRYLHSMGHSDIGYLSSKVGIRNFLERRQGYLAAMADIGQSDNPTTHKIVRVGPAVEDACMDMLAYLGTNPQLPTAFFADNDLIAIGCMRALEDNDIRVPNDISIIGFDNVSMSMLTKAPLTTMEVPKERMGALAVQRLIELIKERTGGETVRISVKPRIVERMSVARAGEIQQ